MPSLTTLDVLKSFAISKSLTAGGQAIDLRLDGAADLPGGVTRLRFTASSGATVPLGASGGSITFHGSADGGFELHLYPDAVSASRAAGIPLTGVPGEMFAVLSLFYDGDLSGNASAPLVPGITASFGASANCTHEWKVVHAFRDGNLIAAMQATFAAWMLPNQVEGPNSLQPGTWMVVHTNGSVKLNAAVAAGYNFSWLRELASGAVTGDLGLKLDAAHLDVALEAGGEAMLIVARETDAPVLRVSVNKDNRNATSWNVSAQGSAVVGIAPNDLVNAIFGIHPSQLVEDLRTGGPTYADFLGLWDRVGSHAASTLVGLAAHYTPAQWTSFANLLDQIQQVATNPLKVAPILEREFGNPQFFATPLGRMLAAGSISAAGLIGDLNAVRQASIYLSAVRDLLHAASPLDTVAALSQLPAFVALDSSLKAKLAAFVGRAPADYTAQDHDSAAAFYTVLTMKAARFLSAAVEATRQKMNANVAAACENASTSSSLIDADFDFGANPALIEWYRAAVSGSFERILSEPVAGVRLRSGVLTHGIQRKFHSELTLPFCGAQSSSMLSSLAKITAMGDQGRILAYELDAADEWNSAIRARLARDSRFGVMAKFASMLPDVRSFGPVEAAIGYSVSVGAPQLSAAQLDRYFAPVLDEYFSAGARERFPSSGIIGDCRAALDVQLPAEALAEWFEAPSDARDPVYFKFARLMQTRLRRIVSDLYFGDPGRYADLGAAAPVLVWSTLPALNSFDGEDPLWDASDPDSYRRVVEDSETRAALRSRCAVIAPFLASIPRLRGVAQFYDVADPGLAAGTINMLLAGALRKPSIGYQRPPLLSALVAFEQDVIRTAMDAAIEAGRFRADAAASPAEAIRHLSRFGDRLVTAFHARLRGCLAVPAMVFTPLGAGLLAEAGRALRIARTGDDIGVRPTAMFSLTILKPGSSFTPEQLLAGTFKLEQVAAERRVIAQ